MKPTIQYFILALFSVFLIGILGCKGSKKKSKTKSNAKSSIQFSKARWSVVRGLAQKENKPIFIDIYTDWCAPCKIMDREVFRDPEIKRFMDANFINYKVNGEKGEGKLMVLNYGVSSYPFLAFVDPQGDAYSAQAGSMSKSQFLSKAKSMLREHQIRYPSID